MTTFKNYIILLFYIILFLVSVLIVHSTNAQFAGGSYGGISTISNISCAYSAYNVYSGGSYDGYSAIVNNSCAYTAYNVYPGGSYDGYSAIVNNPCAYTAYNIYPGGSYDGYATVTDILCGYTAYNVYPGGPYDGYANVSDIPCAYTAYNIYPGGFYDGYATVTDIPCGYAAYNVYVGGSCSGEYVSVSNCPAESWTYPTCAARPPLVLPIELLYFTATLIDNKKVLCEWKTVTEINNDYFTIEKTKNTKRFETIGTTKGAGNSTHTLYYAMTDYAPYQGTSYYRLKQTDYDGKYTYSDLVAVNLKRIDLISIYPNPGDDKFEYLVSTTENTKINITVIDVLGREIISSSKLIKTGINELSLDITSLSAGIYALQIITETGLYKVHKQFMKN